MNRKRVFQSERNCFFIVVLTIVCILVPHYCCSQIEMNATGSYFQNFNSLAKTGSDNIWTDNQTLPGWYWQCGVLNPPLTYISDDGTLNQTGRRCYGTTGDSDRAIGGINDPSFSGIVCGIRLHNSFSQTIKNVSVAYTGEQWRVGTTSSIQQIKFYYRITNDPGITFSSYKTSDWTAVSTLNFNSPKVGPSAVQVLNGNDPSNRVIINEVSLGDLNIPPGYYLLLRWYDSKDTSGEFGLAIDDVTVKWTVPEVLPGSSNVWTGAQSSDWFDSRNWSKATVPDANSDVEIAAVTTKTVCTADIIMKNLVIRNGGQLTIEPGKTITVSGNSNFEGPNGLILKSPITLLQNTTNDHAASASFLCNGTVSGLGTIKVERYISEYLTATDGWHFFSSPVDSPIIDNPFKPGNNDDICFYSETDDNWLSQKSILNGIDHFVNGLGYLVSYYDPSTKTISGLPNNSDVKFTNLSFTGNRGWHLLGNPFTCGIVWGSSDWGISGIGLVSKLLNSGGTYSDLSAGEIIPPMNGFFVKVNSLNNVITIPRAVRLHAISEGWKRSKATPVKKIKLIVSSNSNNTFAETKIMLNENSTSGYDPDYDSPYLSGMPGTPLFYSVLSNGNELSTNCVPDVTSLIFNLEFTPGLAKEYTLKTEISNDWAVASTFILEDKLTKLRHILNNSSSFVFTSDTIDAPGRFKLFIDIVTGMEDTKNSNRLYVSSRDRVLSVTVPDNINSGQVSVYDLSGRQLFNQSLVKGSMNFKLSYSGFYLVQFLFNKEKVTRKVYVP